MLIGLNRLIPFDLQRWAALGSVGLPVCTDGLQVAWYKDLDDIVTIGQDVTVVDFDNGTNILLDSRITTPAGSVYTFNLYMDSEPDGTIIVNGTTTVGDLLINFAPGGLMRITARATGGSPMYDLSSFYNQNIAIELTMSSDFGVKAVEDFKVNNVSQPVHSVQGNGGVTGQPLAVDLTNVTMWDFRQVGFHQWLGTGDNANQDSAWIDQIGSINGTVNGSPGTRELLLSVDIIEESIGTQTRDIYYGQGLSSGIINLYRTPAAPITVMNFDGIDDGIVLSSNPDISGDKKITFDLFLSKESGYPVGYSSVIAFDNVDSDYVLIMLVENRLEIMVNFNAATNKSYSLSGLSNRKLHCSLIKSTSSITSFTINGDVQSSIGDSIVVSLPGSYIGQINSANYLEDANVYNIEVYDDPSGLNTLIHSFNGTGASANLASSWNDSIGSITTAISGTPTLDVISSSTFEYTNPTTGVKVFEVSIPGDGLFTIPVGGICDIYTEDGSYYPICERVGDVLHDVSINAIHISINSPVWMESLYGTDYLNQEGYVTKEQSDTEGYNWETIVNGIPVTLDDNTLVPFGLWEFELLLNNSGNPILDGESEFMYVRGNL